ncbi:MAG TPA: hypothetical protein VLJ18_10705 [Thermoanaerobaculia bacterium]|nr:hypothetical protein [Thermoanaerobaculia bacterium]
MRFPANVRVLAWVGCVGLIPSFSAPAQVSLQFHFGEDDFHRIDSRHPLRGRQYQTMGSLAHTLDEIAQDLNRQAYRTARRDRSQTRLLASVSDFARRTADFHFRMDSYLDSPWDIRRDVNDLARRARGVNQRIVNARLFPRTYDLWNSAIDVLSRMQQVLRGVDVQVPPSPVRHGGEGGGGWEHREADRNDNGVPDRLEGQPPSPPDRGGSRAANVFELRRLGKELDERVMAARDSTPRPDPRGGPDPRAHESFDSFGSRVHRLRETLETDTFDARDLSRTVSRLLDDARRTSDDMRRERTYSGTANEWQRIVDILARMQELL